MKRLWIIGIVAVTLLTGCGMSKQSIGVLTGGAIGGALGSQFGSGSGRILAAVGGTVAGAFIGGAIGNSMDRQDQLEINQALENGRTGQVTEWHNPDSGNTYYVTPTQTYYRDDDQPCRDFTTKAIIGGKTETIYGKACRKADGTWKIVQ